MRIFDRGRREQSGKLRRSGGAPSPAGKVAERKVTEAKSDEEKQIRTNYPLSQLKLAVIKHLRCFGQDKSCPYVYTFIASQTINVSQTRITYHFSLLTRHNVALWGGELRVGGPYEGYCFLAGKTKGRGFVKKSLPLNLFNYALFNYASKNALKPL